MRTDYLWIFLLFAMLLITGVADMKVGHGFLLWLFTVLSWLILRSVSFGGISWFYLFMILFFVLGCWLKVVFHHVLDYPYVEPIGEFLGGGEWGEYYVIAISFAIAFIFAKCLYLVVFGRFGEGARHAFRSVDLLEWVTVLGVVTLFYIVNNIYAFFVTGINPKVFLPLGLNAPLAFMAFSGFPIVISIFVSRDFCSRGYLTTGVFAIVLFSSVLASISMASRAALIMHALPVLLAAVYFQLRNGVHKIGLRPLLMFGFALLIVLAIVSLYRIKTFMSVSIFDEDALVGYALESLGLIVDRWIGAEAIMVAVSHEPASVSLLIDLFLEDPKVGSDGIYQILSGSSYKSQDGFTFLTLPGYFGVLALSGSSLIVFLAGVAIFFLGLCFERYVRWAMFGQGICVAVVCAALANALTQISFPRLLSPFILQLLVLSIIMHFIIKLFFMRTKFLSHPGYTKQIHGS